MAKKYLPNRIDTKKVLLCFLIGLIFLLIILSLTPEYFGVNFPDKWESSLKNFADNLSTSLSSKGSFMEWWTKGISEIDKYLLDNVEWFAALASIAAFIAACFPILQFVGRDLLQIKDKDLRPWKWDMDVTVLEKVTPSKLFFMGKDAFLSIIQEEEENQEEESRPAGLDEVLQKLAGNSYLFLIESYSDQDHFAKYWNDLAQRLLKAGISADAFYYSGDPRKCHKDSGDAAYTLEQLNELYPEAVLVVIGDGKEWVREDLTGLSDWTSQFEQWQQRYLLTPKNYNAWNKHEELVRNLFYLLPAKISSIPLLQLRNNDDPQGPFDIENVKDEHRIDFQNTAFTAQNIQDYFSQPFLDWFGALSIYPFLQYEISLKVKELFFQEEESEFSESSVLSAFELPWFRKGEMPRNIKAEAAKQLAAKAPEVEQDVRKLFKNLLNLKIPGLKPPENSYASLITKEFKNINDWFIKDGEKSKEVKKNIRRNLNEVYDNSNLEPDQLLAISDGPHNRYSKYLSSSYVRQFVFNKGYSGLGLTQTFKNTLRSCLAGLLLLVSFFWIMWLSRPMGGDGDPCIRNTMKIDSPVFNYFSAEIAESPNESRRVHIKGLDDCCVSVFELEGPYLDQEGDLTLNEENSVITGPRNYELLPGDSLNLFIRDTVKIKSLQPFEMTVITCHSDTVSYIFVDTLKRIRVDSTDCDCCDTDDEPQPIEVSVGLCPYRSMDPPISIEDVSITKNSVLLQGNPFTLRSDESISFKASVGDILIIDVPSPHKLHNDTFRVSRRDEYIGLDLVNKDSITYSLNGQVILTDSSGSVNIKAGLDENYLEILYINPYGKMDTVKTSKGKFCQDITVYGTCLSNVSLSGRLEISVNRNYNNIAQGNNWRQRDPDITIDLTDFTNYEIKKRNLHVSPIAIQID